MKTANSSKTFRPRPDSSRVPVDIEKIVRLRKSLGLTQEQCGHAAGIGGRQEWNRIERGRRGGITVETLERIAQVLGVHAKDLLK
jgi:transcriptional regulator with XRE-family HTH domain